MGARVGTSLVPDGTTTGAGPDARLEALARQYGRLISSVVRRITGPASDLVGGDIEQKVLLSLWRQIEREQTIEHPASYICRIAIREAVRVMRQETSRARRAVTDAEAEAQPDSRPDPSESVAGREQREHIESSLAELGPERERAVRAHLAGFAVQEIMEMHTWSYQKARNLIARGMQDLRTALRRRGLHG
jgi:RNA polymerase sigma factor (sigma-70 family)